MLNTEEQETAFFEGRAESPDRVVLTGFRATGKSLVGQLLAEMLGYRFIDTDEEIAARMQSSVAAFVRDHGWPAFRKLEKELLARLVQMKKVVIATGGGAILHEKEWQELRKSSLVVWLQADARTIRNRLRSDPVSPAQRPSLTGGSSQDEVEAVLAEREPRYLEGSDMAIETADSSPDEIAAVIKQHAEKQWVIQSEKE